MDFNMKIFKRVLATLLMLVMLMQPIAMAASVTEFLDFPNNWSTEAMTAAVENGLLIGNGNKLIEPERNLKRSELAAIITRAFGATITTDIGHFDDVKPGDWFYNSVSKAVQMGAMNGTSSSTFHPEASITREEVFTVLARVLCLELDDDSSLVKFSDSKQISSWALDSISGLVANGYIDGYPDGTLRPKSNITRAELAQMFHNLFKTYIDTSGYFNHVAEEGSVIVRAPGAHLENVVINGDLIIADGVGSGDFDLNTVTVKGRILARGGEGTVTFKKVTATENVVIFDRNGIVNFHNYRTDVPFKDNLVEHTPATFLKKQPVAGGSTGPSGGTTVRYSVKFYVDGNVYDSVSVKEGTRVSAPIRNPEKAGYTFMYWSKDDEDDGTGSGFNFNQKIYGDIALHAIFVKFHDITFDLGDGTTKVITIRDGEKLPESKIPVLDDTDTQRFAGWTTPDGVNITKEDIKDYVFDDDTVLVPWYVDKDKKIVTFYDGDTIFDTKEVIIGNKAEKPATDPEKDGAEFKHWGTSADDETPFDFDNEEITDDTKLYAVYEYTVKFDGNAYPEQKVIHGNKITNPGDGAEITGKTFAYWSKSVDGEEYDFASEVTDSFTLYPVYTAKKYEVAFDGETPFDVEHGNTIPTDKIPEKEDTADKNFKGWTATYEDGTTENIPSDAMDEYEVTKPVTFTPWYETKKYEVAFDGEAPFDVEHGSTIPADKIPEKEDTADQNFKGWTATYEEGTTENIPSDAMDEYVVTKPVTFTPWYVDKDKFVVTFYNGSAVHETQEIPEGGKAEKPATDPAAPAGQKFAYWADDAGVEYDFTTPVTGNITLTAVFVPVTAEKFDVTFVVDGTEVHSEEVTDGGYAVGPDETPADTEDKYYIGWIVEGDTTETVVDITTYAITADTVFVALYKDKLIVNFYDLSLDDAPFHTAYVIPGETVAENQYPHHEDNYGESILDFDTDGYVKNSTINSVYAGVDFVHKVPMSYWYVANDSDTKWTKFDSTVVITKDTDVHLNIKQVEVTLDVPQLSANFSLVLWANYNESTRVLDTFKDLLFINETVVNRGFNTAEDDILGKLIDKGLLGENKEIKNIIKDVYLVDVIGEANINKYIWEFVDDNATDEEVDKDDFKRERVEQLVEELCNKQPVTVTEDRLFMFEPILEKLEEFNYEFIESKIPEQLKQVLPMEAIENLFTRFYDDTKHGYVAQMRAAMDEVTGNPDKVVYIGSGVHFMINPISDIFTPALEYALDMKMFADGKLASKFPTYYEYYKDNPYAEALEDYLTTETWFDGSDAGFEGVYSGYTIREFSEYYDVLQAIAVLSDDAILYYYNEVPESDRDAVLDVAFTKLFDIANIITGLLADYAENGIPESLEDFIKSIEKDEKLVEYLEKFGVDAYLDKIAGNANADKVYDTAFDRVMDKFGDKIAALLTKFASSALNRDYDEGEYNRALEILNGLYTTDEDEKIYTVDTIFEEFLGGAFEKSISKKGITVEIARKFLTDISLAK